jgi:hypothetical protein
VRHSALACREEPQSFTPSPARFWARQPVGLSHGGQHGIRRPGTRSHSPPTRDRVATVRNNHRAGRAAPQRQTGFRPGRAPLGPSGRSVEHKRRGDGLTMSGGPGGWCGDARQPCAGGRGAPRR